VSETDPKKAYKKETLQNVVDRMNPLESVNVTRAQYTAKGDTVLTDGVYYNITDDSPPLFQLYFDVDKPVGFVYEQLPPTLDEDGIERTPLDPNALFNNGYVHSVWKKLDYGGAFFRADGGNALPFGTGVQDEELPNVKGSFGAIQDTGEINGAFTKGTFVNNWSTGNTNGHYNIIFSASDGQTNADGTYLSADESVYKDGGHVTPRNYTVIKWIRVE